MLDFLEALAAEVFVVAAVACVAGRLDRFAMAAAPAAILEHDCFQPKMVGLKDFDGPAKHRGASRVPGVLVSGVWLHHGLTSASWLNRPRAPVYVLRMKIERFEDIQGWQEAKKLTVAIYKVTQEEAFARDFGLCDQIRRAAVSVMANIAEGFGRASRKDFMRFLAMANGSALEVQSHLHVALELGYISQEQFDHCYSLCHSSSRLIGGFINYLSKQG